MKRRGRKKHGADARRCIIRRRFIGVKSRLLWWKHFRVWRTLFFLSLVPWKLAREIILGFYARHRAPLCDTHFDIYTKAGITRLPFENFSNPNEINWVNVIYTGVWFVVRKFLFLDSINRKSTNASTNKWSILLFFLYTEYWITHSAYNFANVLFNYRFFLFVRFEYNIVNDIWFNLEDIVSLIL